MLHVMRTGQNWVFKTKVITIANHNNGNYHLEAKRTQEGTDQWP